ncbi:MAG TPA: response regulator [Candidatus Polarisedimenticolia bacterium]|nr:response regulator [Candidatus Polarisedimenticolia bacterium]
MPAQISPIRILVVDDSPEEHTLLAFGLRAIESVKLIGFVHDGFEAVCYLRGAGQFKDREMFPFPDLMLLDFNMPRLNGMDVLRFLRRRTRRPRVILWSNTLDQLNVPLALSLGADVVCRKPSDKSELMEIMNSIEKNIFAIENFAFPEASPDFWHGHVK